MKTMEMICATCNKTYSVEYTKDTTLLYNPVGKCDECKAMNVNFKIKNGFDRTPSV